MKNKGIAKKVTCFVAASALLASNAAYAFEGVKKDESVYVTLTPTGEYKETIVSDWLHSDSTNIEIKDKSILKSIKNVKSDETPTIDGENVTWKSDKNDIFYQGTTDKPLPLEVQVTYYLDGQKIEPQNLSGKSGKIKIIVKIINKDAHKAVIKGKSKTIFTPFTTAAVTNLPMDNFTNVKTTSGQVICDGNNQVVTFIAFPGMQESLGIDSSIIKFPEETTIEADVNNFKMGPIMITATPKLPEMDKIKGAGNIDELFDGIKALEDAASKLSAGTTTIAEASSLISQNMDALKTGLEKLSPASVRINEGVLQLAQGTGSALDGAKKLSQGISVLEQGASSLGVGAENFTKGATQFAENSTKFANGAQSVSDGASVIADKTGELSTGLNNLVNATDKLKEGQNQITNGSKASLDAIAKLKKGKEKENGAIKLLIGGIDGLKGVVSFLGNIPGTGEIAEKLNKGLDGQKSGLNELLNSGNQFVAGLDELEKGISSIKVGSEKLSAGLNEVQNGQNLAASGAKQIAEGGKKLKPAAQELKNGSNGLSAGASQLVDGAGKLKEGTSKIGPGTKELKAGADSLVGGLSRLDGGAKQLSKGTGEFTVGISQAASGISRLNDGTKKLAAGTRELDINMNRFKVEGIDKLHRELASKVGNIDEVMASKDAIVNLSKEYETFSGEGETIKGSVKFIMKTDEIKAPETKAVENKPVKTEHKGFFSWLKNLFR